MFCWSNCTVNVLLVWSFPSLVPVLTAAWEIWAVAVAVATVAVAVRGLVVATPAPRRDVFALLVPIGTAALTEAAYAIGLWVNPAENPRDRMFVTLFVARGLSYAAIAAGLVWTLLEQRRTRLAVARLAEDLGAAPEPGTLRSVLVRSLNDPELEVVYPQPGSSGKVNAEGQLVPLPTPPRVATSHRPQRQSDCIRLSPSGTSRTARPRTGDRCRCPACRRQRTPPSSRTHTSQRPPCLASADRTSR